MPVKRWRELREAGRGVFNRQALGWLVGRRLDLPAVLLPVAAVAKVRVAPVGVGARPAPVVGHGAAQRGVAVEVQPPEPGQVPQGRGQGAGETVVVEAQVVELGEPCQGGGDGPGQGVAVEVKVGELGPMFF